MKLTKAEKRKLLLIVLWYRIYVENSIQKGYKLINFTPLEDAESLQFKIEQSITYDHRK